MAADRNAANQAMMDPVADLLGGGRTVAYKAVLAHACGGATVGLLLSQLWYWTNTPAVRERDGWFWKTMEEITEETGLTRSEQETARKKLKQLGVLAEEFRELPRKLYFRVDKRRLYEVLSAHAGNGGGAGDPTSRRVPGPAINNAENPHYGGGETRAIARGKSAGSNAGNRQAITEKTAKTTQEKTTTKSEAVATRPKSGSEAVPDAGAVVVLAQTDQGHDAGLVDLLVAAGMGKSAACRLAAQVPDECRRQLEFLPFASGIRGSRGAYLRCAIEEGYGPPPAWEEARRMREKHEKREKEKRRAREHPAAAVASPSSAEREQTERAKEELRLRHPELWGQMVAEAEAALPVPVRRRPDSPAYRAVLNARLDEAVGKLKAVGQLAL